MSKELNNEHLPQTLIFLVLKYWQPDELECKLLIFYFVNHVRLNLVLSIFKL